MNHKIASAVAAVLAAGPAPVVLAQETTVGLDEIIVTAQRRAESLQDVPIAVQALTGDTLVQLNVSTLDDYVRFLPSVTTANFGPGQSNIYMRGLATGALGTQGSGTNGPWPNVAVYLDEQSTQTPGRNLDLYAADLERIEVLTGPQGTLFGAGAQAGVLRYITNKPVLNETSTNLKAGYTSTSGGDDGYNVEAVVNLPLIDDKLALRVVAYQELRGGYIDNVPSTFTRRSTDLGFALLNGGVVPANSVVINNDDVVGDDINEVEYQGARGSLKWQISDDWDAILALTYQKIDSEGVFYQLPVGSEGQDLDELEVTIFNDAFTKDETVNTALTVTGKIGALDFIYAGGYLTRDSETVSDYTNYARGVYGVYYQCSGIFSTTIAQQCFSPSSFWNDTSDATNMSHEIRLSSPVENRLRFVGGVYYEERDLEATTDWYYKSLPECPDTGVSVGDCFLYLDPLAAPSIATATLNNPNRRDPNVGFFNDFTREYTQFAAFASVDFDILENLTLTLGTRYYDIENSFRGAFMGSFFCKTYGSGASGPCVTPFGGNVDEREDNENQDDGFRSRANLSWQVNDDVMVYATWSESYRPGGFNRASAACGVEDPVTNTDQWCMPTSYESDDLENIELGWKSVFWDNRVQFNGAVYQVTWDNVQSGLFAPQLGFPNLQFFTNGPEYEVNGIEVNIVVVPVDGLTISASASYNDTELKNSPQIISNNPASPTFGEPITESCLVFDTGTNTCTNVVSVENVFGTPGTPLAFAPDFQGNVRARYEWTRGDYSPYVGAAIQYQDESYSSASVVNLNTMPSWTTADASVGFMKSNWGAELYVTNLTDENKSVYTTQAQFIVAEVPMRPRTLGLRFTYNFDRN